MKKLNKYILIIWLLCLIKWWFIIEWIVPLLWYGFNIFISFWLSIGSLLMTIGLFELKVFKKSL
jgi:hypothetical protein